MIKGNIFDRGSEAVVNVVEKAQAPVNYRKVWGRESGRQPGLMCEVLDMGRVPFKKISS